MVVNYSAKQWKPLQPCLPIMLRIVPHLCPKVTGKDDTSEAPELLKEALEAFEEVASYSDGALFFKTQLKEIAMMMSEICSAKDALNTEVRSAALEFFVTLAEKKTKLCMKEYPQYPAYLLKAAMDFMLEIVSLCSCFEALLSTFAL